MGENKVINLRLVLPGDVPVKKNTVGELWYRVDRRSGNKIPLAKPIKYYQPVYKKWIGEHVVRVEEWKKQHPEISFPLKGSFVCSFVMFRKRRGTVDLSNLYEAIQDLLNGHGGGFLNKFKVRQGRKTKVPYDHTRYQVLEDDDCKTIACHGASTVIYVPKNPRLEIFISEFKLEQIAFLLKNLHPGLELSNYVPESGQSEMFADNDLDDLLKEL